VFARQVPPLPVLVRAQFVSGPDMATKHFPSPATLQTDDIVALNGSADRHGWNALDRLLGGLNEIAEGRMNIPNK
jgi:hypothetical protein